MTTKLQVLMMKVTDPVSVRDSVPNTLYPSNGRSDLRW